MDRFDLDSRARISAASAPHFRLRLSEQPTVVSTGGSRASIMQTYHESGFFAPTLSQETQSPVDGGIPQTLLL